MMPLRLPVASWLRRVPGRRFIALATPQQPSSPVWVELREEKRLSRDNMRGREGFNTALRRNREGMKDDDDSHGQEQMAVSREVALLGRQRRWQEALEVFDTVADPSTRLRTAIMDVCVRSSQFQLAQKIFEEMPKKTLPAYSVYIAMLGRERRTVDLEEVKGRIRADGLELSVVTYGSLVTAFGYARDLRGMFRVLAEMKEGGLVCGPVIYGAAMAACAKAGDSDQTEKLFQEMEATRAQPDVGHYTSLVVACARDKNEARAREAFEAMKRRGLKPDVVVYTGLLGTLAGPEAFSNAEAIFKEMLDSSLEPDNFVYNAVAKAALVAERPEDCRRFLAEAKEKGLRPNQETGLIEGRLRNLEERIEAQRRVATLAPLPKGWREHKDLQSGQSYYWQEADPAGTTTWQRPA